MIQGYYTEMTGQIVLNDYAKNVYILKSLNDIDKINRHTPFQRKCPTCGRILFNKELYMYKKDKFKMECWDCLAKKAKTSDTEKKRLASYNATVRKRYNLNPDKYGYLNKPLEIDIHNLNLLDNLVLHSKLKYICVCCGKEVIINDFRPYRINTYKRLLCHDCNSSYYWKNLSDQKRQEIRHKKMHTSYELYNLPAPPTIKYLYYGVFFDSKPELAVWIYYIDHNIPIVRTPCILNFKFDNRDDAKYTPDFWIYGIGLVEIKGKHLVDASGNWINPFDASKNRLYEAKHQCAINNNVKIMYEKDYINYINYVNSVYGEYYLDLFRINNPYNPSYFGLNGYNELIKPYIYIPEEYSKPSIPGKGISPFEIDKNAEYTFAPFCDVNTESLTFNIKQ